MGPTPMTVPDSRPSGWSALLLRAFLLLLALGIAVPDEIAIAKKKKKDGDQSPVFYPDLPVQPRLQWLASFSSEKDIRPKRGRFMKMVLGEEETIQALVKPYGVTMHDGKIFVCDGTRKNVAILDIRGREFSTLGARPPGALNRPVNISIDEDGTRYVADIGHKRIMVYDAENQYSRAIGDPEKFFPTDVVIAGDLLYATDVKNGQVVVFDKGSGEELRRISRKGGLEGELFHPTNLALDQKGNIYVTDTGNFRVQKFDPKGKLLQQIGSIGKTLGHFTRPKGIALDREGRIYVVDAAFDNVQIFDPEGKLLLPFARAGNHPGGLNLPAKVAIDYDNIDLFKDRVAPGHDIEYLVLVSSQFGKNKVNVYGFLKTGD